jgi:hypothetical protein
MLGSQYPSLEEEADWYIKGLEACMREAKKDLIAPSCRDPNRWRNEDWYAAGKQNGFDLATKTILNTP